jgi:hypothetical protein
LDYFYGISSDAPLFFYRLYCNQNDGGEDREILALTETIAYCLEGPFFSLPWILWWLNNVISIGDING